MPRRPLPLLAALACAAALASLAPAQAKKGRKLALLVGVKDYEHPSLSKLRFTENDVEALAERLKSPSMGYDSVRLLTTAAGARDDKDMPTAANIRREVERLLDEATGRDTVLVAFSGHGVQLKVKDPGEGGRPERAYSYFCPSDCDFRGVSYSTGAAKRLIEMQALFTELGGGRAREKLVLIDACRNERDAEASTRNVNTQAFRVPTGVGVLFSCKAEQVAWEHASLGKGGHGVFFHFVLEGLSGKAKNEEGEVTWDDLSAYVKRQVIRRVGGIVKGGATQTPHGVGSLEGETVLARFDAGVVTPEKEPVKRGPRQGDKITNSVGMELEFVPAGSFVMGSSKKEQDEAIEEQSRFVGEVGQEHVNWWFRCEGPPRIVTIRNGFYMGIHEVTQKQYKQLVGANPSYFSRDGGGKKNVSGLDTSNFPVEQVSYENAVEFCRKLSGMDEKAGSKRSYRLPAEAEWEYACRREAGPTTPFSHDSSLHSSQANFNGIHPYGGAAKGKYLECTCKVGSYKANRYGLYDMTGNVSEWCADWFNPDYYSQGENTDPKGPGDGKYRVLRGGSWVSPGWDCRSARRGRQEPGEGSKFIGFRVVCGPPADLR